MNQNGRRSPFPVFSACSYILIARATSSSAIPCDSNRVISLASSRPGNSPTTTQPELPGILPVKSVGLPRAPDRRIPASPVRRCPLRHMRSSESSPHQSPASRGSCADRVNVRPLGDPSSLKHRLLGAVAVTIMSISLTASSGVAAGETAIPAGFSHFFAKLLPFFSVS